MINGNNSHQFCTISVLCAHFKQYIISLFNKISRMFRHGSLMFNICIVSVTPWEIVFRMEFLNHPITLKKNSHRRERRMSKCTRYRSRCSSQAILSTKHTPGRDVALKIVCQITASVRYGYDLRAILGVVWPWLL